MVRDTVQGAIMWRRRGQSSQRQSITLCLAWLLVGSFAVVSRAQRAAGRGREEDGGFLPGERIGSESTPDLIDKWERLRAEAIRAELASGYVRPAYPPPESPADGEEVGYPKQTASGPSRRDAAAEESVHEAFQPDLPCCCRPNWCPLNYCPDKVNPPSLLGVLIFQQQHQRKNDSSSRNNIISTHLALSHSLTNMPLSCQCVVVPQFCIESRRGAVE